MEDDQRTMTPRTWWTGFALAAVGFGVMYVRMVRAALARRRERGSTPGSA